MSGYDASIIRVHITGQAEPDEYDGAVWTAEMFPGWLRLSRSGQGPGDPVRATWLPDRNIERVETEFALRVGSGPVRKMTQVEYEATHGN